MSAVLVSGGAGYIGSQTAKVLARHGRAPVVLDNLSTGHAWAVRWGPLIEGDIADAALVRDVVRRHDITSAIHFAAHAYVGESVTDPRKYYTNNVIGSLSLVHALLDAGVRRIVFSSTCATYGIPERLPLDEEHPQRPVNPYGESKLAVERALRAYDTYGLRSVSLRYFNASGADDDGELGELHEPETHLIPLAIRAARGEGSELTVFGADYPTDDGTAIRDYVHVADLADAHVAALAYLEAGGATTAINLGTGAGSSVLQICRAVEAAGGRPVPLAFGPRRAGDPPILVAAAERARAVLGWQPQRRLPQIVESAWTWQERGYAEGRGVRSPRRSSRPQTSSTK